MNPTPRPDDAAEFLGLYPRKGVLEVGSDADMVIIDLDQEQTLSVDLLHQNSPWRGVYLRQGEENGAASD